MHEMPVSETPMQQSMQLQPGLAQALTKAQNPVQTTTGDQHTQDRKGTPTSRGGRVGNFKTTCTRLHSNQSPPQRLALSIAELGMYTATQPSNSGRSRHTQVPLAPCDLSNDRSA